MSFGNQAMADFGDAIRALKRGNHVQRDNGPRVALWPLDFGMGRVPYLVAWGQATNGPVIWHPSQHDLLATDWIIIEKGLD